MLITDLLKFVTPHVPGCPTPTVRQAVMDSAIEFLTESQAWDEILDPVPVVDGVYEYDLEAPQGAVCIDVKDVYTRTSRLVGKTVGELAEIMPDWQTAQASSPAYYTRGFSYTSLRVCPIPLDPVDETITVHGIFTLSPTATQIPDVIVTRHREAIVSGALGRLMLMPGQSWTNAQLGQYHRDLANDKRASARVTAAHSKTSQSPSVRPRRFGQ